jgi:hypothetical protein
MQAFLSVGKNRYCQGLPILASATVLAPSPEDAAVPLTLESLSSGDTDSEASPVHVDLLSGESAGQLKSTSRYFLPFRTRDAGGGLYVNFYEVDTNLIDEGAYFLTSLQWSAISPALVVMAGPTYFELLNEENDESFGDQRIAVSEVFSLVRLMVSDHWRIEGKSRAFLQEVRQLPAWHPFIRLSGHVESETRNISLAKLRYGVGAMISDLGYLSSVPLDVTQSAEPNILEVRIDPRGNVMLHARAQIDVMRPDQLLEVFNKHADLRYLHAFAPQVFSSTIEMKDIHTVEMSVTITAESETGTTSRTDFGDVDGLTVGSESETSRGEYEEVH